MPEGRFAGAHIVSSRRKTWRCVRVVSEPRIPDGVDVGVGVGVGVVVGPRAVSPRACPVGEGVDCQAADGWAVHVST
eukprot:9439-Pyramimonas_sp.AAC.1